MRSDLWAGNPLRVEIKDVDDAVVVQLSGQVNDLGADTVSGKLDEILEAGATRIIFDLSDIRFMGSSGLGQIMRAYQAVKKNGYVRIVNPQPLIADVFKLTKLDKLLKIYPSVTRALQDSP